MAARADEWQQELTPTNVAGIMMLHMTWPNPYKLPE
jgi:hypothetical protein